MRSSRSGRRIPAARVAARRRAADRAVSWGARAGAFVLAMLLVAIAAFLLAGSLPALRAVRPLAWILDPAWRPTDAMFGLLPMVAGTLAVTAGAVIVTVPLGVMLAVFCGFHAPPWMATAVRHALGVAAGIPSVVFGLFGLQVLVPWIARIQAPGTSVLAGVLVLSLMTLPTVALAADAALAAVPRTLVLGGAALGLGRDAVAWRIAVPAARSGILTGSLLQAARAIGETMAVLMVCGNVVQAPQGLFDPVRTLTANIALEMGYAGPVHRSALLVSGLVLFLVVAALVGWSSRIRERAP